MDKQKVRDRIMEIGIVPVVRASSPRDARIAADAVCEGGIPIVEITMTVPGAIDVIRELTKNAASEVLVGAGTVLNAEAARRCLDAGAQFLVSPGLNLQTVELAVIKGPLPQVRLVPTGGVNLDTAAEFIQAGAAALGVGGELVQAEALKSNKPEIIVENARRFLAIVKQARAQMASSGMAAKRSH